MRAVLPLLCLMTVPVLASEPVSLLPNRDAPAVAVGSAAAPGEAPAAADAEAPPPPVVVTPAATARAILERQRTNFRLRPNPDLPGREAGLVHERYLNAVAGPKHE